MDNRETLQFALNFNKYNSGFLIVIILTTTSMISAIYSLYLSMLFPVIFLYIGLSAVAGIELWALTYYIKNYLLIKSLLSLLKEEVSD
jgi:hypothetical protein